MLGYFVFLLLTVNLKITQRRQDETSQETANCGFIPDEQTFLGGLSPLLSEDSRRRRVDLLQRNPFTRRQRGESELGNLLCYRMLLLPFISITSHQNSSPTEVATVPLAIKIMLGHATVVRDSTPGNKSGGG